MARRVDEIERVDLPVFGRIIQGDGVHLDRDAALALEVHRVEMLLFHLAHADRFRELEQPVGERGLAVVDVGDNAEVADVRRLAPDPVLLTRCDGHASVIDRAGRAGNRIHQPPDQDDHDQEG